LALDVLYPARLAVLNELRSSGPAMLLGTAFFSTVLLGLALFLFGIGIFLVETFGFKRRLIKGELAPIVKLFLTETWKRNFPTTELPGALTPLGGEPMPFKQALCPEDEPKSRLQRKRDRDT